MSLVCMLILIFTPEMTFLIHPINVHIMCVFITMSMSLLTSISFSPCQMSTRRAYGLALAKLGQASQRVVALDGDTKNSTFSETFKKAFPERYIECFIAEQNMVILSYERQINIVHSTLVTTITCSILV